MKYLILMTFFLAACTPMHKAVSTRNVTLCEVQLDRDGYDGKSIVFRARISSDGIENTSIWDPECRNFSLSVDHNDGSADWSDINKIIYSVGDVGTSDKIISADISGVFHKMPRNGKISVMSITKIRYSLI